jgi:hypothetical protein
LISARSGFCGGHPARKRTQPTYSVEKLAERSFGPSCGGTSTLGVVAIIDPGSIYEVVF